MDLTPDNEKFVNDGITGARRALKGFWFVVIASTAFVGTLILIGAH